MKSGVSCLERLPRSEGVEKEEIDARTIMGLYLFQMNYPVKAKETIDPITDRASKMNYKRRLPLIHNILGQYELEVEENFPKAFNHLEEALRISEETNDILSLFFANYTLGLALIWDCAFEKATYHFKKALQINRAVHNLWGISAMKTFLSHVDLYRGITNLGPQGSEEALHLAEDSGDIYSKGISFITHGISCFSKGFFSEAEKYLLKGTEFCERINFFFPNYSAHYYLGEMYLQLQDYEKAIGCYEKAIGYIEKAQFGPSFNNACRTGIVKAKVMSGQRDINIESLYGYARGNNMKILDGLTKRSVAEILFHMDDKQMDEAGFWLNQAIEADRQNGMMWELAQDYLSYAELLKRKDDGVKAKELLGKAIETFQRCGDDGWVEKYEKEMAILA